MRLTAKFTSIDSDNSLFKQMKKGEISHLVERIQFNKRERNCIYFKFLFLPENGNTNYFLYFRLNNLMCQKSIRFVT